MRCENKTFLQNDPGFLQEISSTAVEVGLKTSRAPREATVSLPPHRKQVVLTMIRVPAFTLTLVFFHRQVRSHLRSCSFGFCDLAQRLAYQFIATPQPDSS
jgi:hypothetical protein